VSIRSSYVVFWFVMERLASLCIVVLHSWTTWDDVGFQICPLGWVSICSSCKKSTLDSHLSWNNWLPFVVYILHIRSSQILNSHRVSIWAHVLSLSNFQRDLVLSCWYLLNLTYYIVRICEYLIVSIFIRSKNRMVPEKLDSIRSNCWRDKEVEGPRSATKLHLSICDGRHKRKSKWHRYIPFM
jgi:hypothetical protein